MLDAVYKYFVFLKIQKFSSKHHEVCVCEWGRGGWGAGDRVVQTSHFLSTSLHFFYCEILLTIT